MNQESIETEHTPPSLGRALQEAREAAKLSVDEVAERLKLSPQSISQLEQDDYNKLGPLTFVRGYLKSYCGVLGLPVEETLTLFKTPEVQVTTKHMQSFSRRTEKEASDSRLMIISYVILLITLGASGIWWWQSSTKVSSADATPVTPEPAMIKQEEVIESAVTEQVITDTGVIEPAKPVQSDIETVDTPVTLDLQSQVLSTELENNKNEVESKIGLSTIVMRFSDDSWVEIFDATQERIAFGVKKAGYTMTVEGEPPFSVVLNKHLMVEVELDGKLIDLTALPKNRLAKFKLPLVE
jgi:cytoskeleton protein RodZ